MTPVFSTVINFSLKGCLDRIHRLNYISSIECSEDIILPRMKRRLLQFNEELEESFSIPLMDVETEIKEDKKKAISLSQ